MANSTDRIVVTIGTHTLVVTDPEAAFGGDFPETYRQALITSTADSIATITLLESLKPIIVSFGDTGKTMIEERRRGLTALGVKDVEAEVQAAIQRLQALGADEIAKRAVVFMI